MRHLKSGRKLNRTSAHRRALMRNLANALITQGTIKTTLPKAKELRPYVEKLITTAIRKGKEVRNVNQPDEPAKLNAEGVALRRLLFSRLRSRTSVLRLCETIAPQLAERPGGYTRIVKAGYRSGDSAPMAVIQLLIAEAAAEQGGDDAKAEANSETKAQAAAG